MTTTLSRTTITTRAFRAEPDSGAYDPFLTFTDRVSYLAWVQAWKAEYAQTVADIREAKSRRRDKTQSTDDRNMANQERQGLRHEAHTLLMLRKAGKVRSARMRQELVAQAA